MVYKVNALKKIDLKINPLKNRFQRKNSSLDERTSLDYFIDYSRTKKHIKFAVTFLDIKAAFDSVSIYLLWQKLNNLVPNKLLIILISLFNYSS